MEPNERLWSTVGTLWLRAALGEIRSETAIDAILMVARKELGVTLVVELDGEDGDAPVAPPSVRHPLQSPSGERVGTLVVRGALSAEDEARLVGALARLIDLPSRITLSRVASHDVANKLASLLANAELLEWLTGKAQTERSIPADELSTLHDAATACLEVTRELVTTMASLQAQRRAD